MSTIVTDPIHLIETPEHDTSPWMYCQSKGGWDDVGEMSPARVTCIACLEAARRSAVEMIAACDERLAEMLPCTVSIDRTADRLRHLLMTARHHLAEHAREYHHVVPAEVLADIDAELGWTPPGSAPGPYVRFGEGRSR